MGANTPEPNSERRLAALARVLKALRETDDLSVLIPAVLDNLKAELSYTVLWLGIYDRINHWLVAQGHVSPKPHRLLKARMALQPGDLMEQVVIQQRALIVNDLRVEPRAGDWADIAEDLAIQGALIFPVRQRDTCQGVMVLGAPEWGKTITAGDRTYLSTVLGTLADVLHRHEKEELATRLRRPETPIFQLVQRVSPLGSCDSQLEMVLRETFRFIEPDRARIFWLEPATLVFWERLVLQSSANSLCKTFEADTSPLTIPAANIRVAYQDLCNHQMLAVGESQGASTVSVPEQLMQLLDARSLLAVPIVERDDLRGFLSVEGRHPRIWKAADKDYLTAAGRFLGMILPNSTITHTLEQSAVDYQVLAGAVRSIQNDGDWRRTLELCSGELCDRLAAHHFIVLSYDADLGIYQPVFQTQVPNRRVAGLVWPRLDDVDWQMLERSAGAIAVSDLTHDLKLAAWRGPLQALGLRSVLVCNTSPGYPPEGVVLVACVGPRHWETAEADLLSRLSQQIGLILHQWQLQRLLNQHDRLHDAIQRGLQTLQRTFDETELAEAASATILDILQVTMVAIVTWELESNEGRVSHCITRHKDFSTDPDYGIDLASDAVVNWAMQSDKMLPVTWEDLPLGSRVWLSAPPRSQLLLMALRTAPEHLPNAVLILADRRDRQWSDYHLGLVALLANQLAWSRRHLSLVNLLLAQRADLETLNWYKQKRLDEVHRRLRLSLQRLNDPITQGRGLSAQRQLQLVRQLSSLMESIHTVLTDEAWQLGGQQQTIPLISLLNRLMERANPLIQARHLWAKVHNDSNVTIGGDLVKIEFVLYELLTAACERSPEQGRLDIWCRPLNANWLELSITDDGTVPDRLLDELQNGRPLDILAPSPLDTPPGLHFAICQALMQQMAGEFSLQRLEDNRMISRVLLAIAPAAPPSSSMPSSESF